jgi:ketosteroid isomerase-like protein
VLRFCGVRRGKAAVLDMMQRQVAEVFDIYSFVTDTMLIEGDRVATFNRLSARMGDDGRVISYRLAHFMRFRDGKVVENISLIDSFDAAEQVLGHPLAGQAGEPARRRVRA